MRFPVLVSRGRAAAITFFELVPRPQSAFVLTDDLSMNMEDSPAAFDYFMLAAKRFFPNILLWQLDWPQEEQATLRAALSLRKLCRIIGDSWTMPLLFAFDCLQRGRNWPVRILASGAMRQCRGVRCVSIGGVLNKLRRAEALRSLLYLPRANVLALQRRGVDVGNCVILPPNVKQCLDIWREQA